MEMEQRRIGSLKPMMPGENNSESQDLPDTAMIIR